MTTSEAGKKQRRSPARGRRAILPRYHPRMNLYLTPDTLATIRDLVALTGGIGPALDLLVKLLRESGFRVP